MDHPHPMVACWDDAFLEYIQIVPIRRTAPNVLGNTPAVAKCQSCGFRRTTAVTFEPSTKTHLLAFGICLLGGICCLCIPYCTNTCQTASTIAATVVAT